jgi:hypothetical protein
MAKSKYDFIKEILVDVRLKPEQRERVLQLASREMEGEKNLDMRVTELEKILSKGTEFLKSNFQDKKEKPKKLLEKGTVNYLAPDRLKKFLFTFNQNKILRSTCHDIDSDELQIINSYCNTKEYSFQNHLKVVSEEYLNHDKTNDAPFGVKALFRAYLLGKNYQNENAEYWSLADKIQINWSSPGLMDWSIRNKGFPPHPSEGLEEQLETVGFEFKPFTSVTLGRTIQNFRDLVIHFKHLFHIRSDNSLKSIIKNKNRSFVDKIDFIIDDVKFPSNIELFTDVERLIKIYEKILSLALEAAVSSDIDPRPRIKLSFSECENGIDFSIHHINSQYGKTLEQTFRRGIGKTYSQLFTLSNGYCDLYLNADFGQSHSASINLWDGKEWMEGKLDSIQGVEHVLRFPK